MLSDTSLHLGSGFSPTALAAATASRSTTLAEPLVNVLSFMLAAYSLAPTTLFIEYVPSGFLTARETQKSAIILSVG